VITALQTKEVGAIEIRVTLLKRPNDTRIHLLNLALDTNILNHVKVVARDTIVVLLGLRTHPSFGRSIECVTNLVADEHIVEILVVVLPER